MIDFFLEKFFDLTNFKAKNRTYKNREKEFEPMPSKTMQKEVLASQARENTE